ncbi:MAG TPA: condensation domain-containing protein, partial [Candidatus Dormibacteraeota bacterium]|nr:condensation domain-containing protein [Candidatus Dormibacteraeota bacterium]
MAPARWPQLIAVDRRGGAPLSFAQLRLWFLDQLVPANPFYNVGLSWRLQGRLDVPALEWALSGIAARHEVLRTAFPSVGGRPVQLVAAPGPVRVRQIDLRGPADGHEEARRLATEESSRPFDLRRGPVWRALLLRLADEEHALLLTFHHIVSDQWSMDLVRKELSELYRARVRGTEARLEPLSVQYADYAVWQRRVLDEHVLAPQLAYWRERLAAAPAALDLPTDRERSTAMSYRGGNVRFRLADAVHGALSALCRRERVTLFMALLAAFQVLLLKHSGQRDIVVGTPVAQRTRSALQGLIGLFVNTVVLRVDLSGDPSFRELLGRVRSVCLGALDNGDLPFEQLVEELQPERGVGRNPLAQVFFQLWSGGTIGEPPVLFGLQGEEFEFGWSPWTHFDLELYLSESEDGALRGQLVYSQDLFDGETVARMVQQFQLLLSELAAQPDRRLSWHSLLTPEERRRWLEDSRGPRASYPEAPLHVQFEERVDLSPDAVAVESGRSALTCAELDARANQLAWHLRALGVRTEQVVGLCVERGPELLIGLLGIVKAAGAYLPLDPGDPDERLRYVVADAGARVVVTGSGTAPRDWGAGVRTVDLASGHVAARSRERPGARVLPDNLAYVVYTSGSTGRPKGVMVSHRNAGNLVHWHLGAYRVSGADRASLLAATSFDASVWE